MLILDITVVAIALPHMGAELDLDRAALTWVVSGYALTFGSLMLLGGRAADLFGAKRVVLAGLAVFTAASLAAGLATGAPLLLGARIAQGAGAAMLSPAALSVVVRLFDGDERNRALGIWSALGGGGAALGVLLGGLITAGPGWAWVFFVNVPVGLIVLVALARMLPRLPRLPRAATGSLDVPGAALVAAATGALIYALIRAGDHGWLDAVTVVLVAFSAAAYAVRCLRRLAAPGGRAADGPSPARPAPGGGGHLRDRRHHGADGGGLLPRLLLPPEPSGPRCPDDRRAVPAGGAGDDGRRYRRRTCDRPSGCTVAGRGRPGRRSRRHSSCRCSGPEPPPWSPV